MSTQPPLVVAMLHADEDDIDYQLYTQAYGLEMQIDDEWEAEVVLLAPHEHLASVTENTDVTGEDTAIVSAGVTDIPIRDDGLADVAGLQDARNNWLLVGDPRLNDTDDVINKKLRAALGAGCRAIVCVTDPANEQVAARLDGIESIDRSRFVIAFVGAGATAPDVATNTAQIARDRIVSMGATGNPRFIVGGNFSADNALELVAREGIDGVFLMDDKYDGFECILELLETLGE